MLYRLLSLLLVIISLASCATIDFDYPKSDSRAFTKTDKTYFGKQVQSELANQPAGYAGFYLLPDGIDALNARMLLASRAEISIDAQYYELKYDSAGRAFIKALLDAADRGVRVRLLVDDITTQGYDAGMVGLDSHPNLEIRVFNPFANRRFRKLDGLTSFSRVNRRMHNKSFTVDNQVTIFGGRNIADEYFGVNEDAIFFDLDVAAIGPITQRVSQMFDDYWNHERAAPLPAFAKLPQDPDAELTRIRKELSEWENQISDTKLMAVAEEKYLKLTSKGKSMFTWAPFKFIFDSPDKAFKSRAEKASLLKGPIKNSLLEAEKEIIIISPYFVPIKPGIEALSKLQNDGIDIAIITNSRAANNQALVHAGYAPARKPLLKNGVKIYEVRPSAQVIDYETVDVSSAKATLHTKAYIVDRSALFVGSFNFDQRSININTELGVIIDSPVLAAQFAGAVDSALKEKTFEVFLNKNNKLRWRANDGGQEIIYKKEPHTTWWQRMAGNFLQLLPIKSQL